jgi:hypothetical protein
MSSHCPPLPSRSALYAKLTTNQGDRLKSTFESIKDYIHECRLFFRENNMEFVGNDRANRVVFRYIIQKDAVEKLGGTYEFIVSSSEGTTTIVPIEVFIKTKTLATFLRCSSQKDTISFEIDAIKRPNVLVFEVWNASGVSTHAEISLPLPDSGSSSPSSMDVEQYNSARWVSAVTMPSAKFHEIVRNLVAADPDPALIHLYYDGEILKFSTAGLLSRVSCTVATDKQYAPKPLPLARIKGEDEEEEEDPSTTTTTAAKKKTMSSSGIYCKNTKQSAGHFPIEASYHINFIQRVVKAKGVCSRITIYMRKKFPVAFVYFTQIGVLSYMISPSEEEEETVVADVNGLSSSSTTSTIGKHKRKEEEEEEDAATAEEVVFPAEKRGRFSSSSTSSLMTSTIKEEADLVYGGEEQEKEEEGGEEEEGGGGGGEMEYDDA